MKNIPTQILCRTPQCLSPRWQHVFASLVAPIKLVISIRQNRELALPRKAVLQHYWAEAVSLQRQMPQTLAELDTVAPKTWEAAWEIRLAVSPVFGLLKDLEVLGRISSDRQRKSHLTTIRCELVEVSRRFSERPLLEALRNAVTAEKGIDLASPKPEEDRDRAQHPRKRRTPGRPRGSNTAAADTRLYRDWKAAHDATGITKPEFIRERGLQPSALAALERGRANVRRQPNSGRKRLHESSQEDSN